MKKYALILIAVLLAGAVRAQKYEKNFFIKHILIS